MKYNLSIDEILGPGYVVKVDGVPSWFDNLFGRSINEKYIVCRDGLNFICAQKVGSNQVFQLVEKSENGVWCREIKKGELGPEYRAPMVMAEVYRFMDSHYAGLAIEEVCNEILKEVEEK